MAEINFLNGLSPEEVEDRRNKRFLKLSPEEKLKTLFALIEISLLTGENKCRPKAKLTLKRKSGHS